MGVTDWAATTKFPSTTQGAERGSSVPLADPAAGAAYALRAHVLGELAGCLRIAGLDALLVKGAALALTVYPRAWEREMRDIDLLVRPGTREQIIGALERAGFSAFRPAGRPLTSSSLGETALRATYGGVPMLLEVHTQLDKVVSRPIDYAGVFGRALPAPGYPGLLVPAPEDHVLLVALHAATAEFRHPPALGDLALLLRAGVDEHALVERARQWRLGTATFALLQLLGLQEGDALRRGLSTALRPGQVRLAALRRFHHLDERTASRGPCRLGWSWALRQTAVRDDFGRWVVGLARYAALRAVERLLCSRRADEHSSCPPPSKPGQLPTAGR
jgi:hypothetical protein